MDIKGLSVTNHGIKKLKERGLIPQHFSVHELLDYLSTQINDTYNDIRSRHRIVMRNGGVVVIDDNMNVVTGYWGRSGRFNKCR
jgi:hypothetical protein